MKPIEIRTLPIDQAGIEIRDLGTPEKPQKMICGYASVFFNGKPETEFKVKDGYFERIMPGAFRDAVANDDVRALFNHNADNLLGCRSSGTLQLEEDARGLRYSIPYDDSDPDHKRVMAKIQRGDLRGSSFGFRVLEQNMAKENGNLVRNIGKVKLVDVGPVTYPAYQGTEACARSLDGAFDAEKIFIESEKSASEQSHNAVKAEIDKAKARARATEVE